MPVPAAPKTELIGRDSLIAEILQAVEQGRRVFALEGISGVGKSAALASVVKELEGRKYCPASLNAADHASEELAIAAIYLQLKALPQDPEAVAVALGRRLGANVPKMLRAITGAVVADVLKLATDKASKTVDTIQKIISGDLETSAVEDALEQLDESNKRLFLTHFLGALADAGTHVAIAIDHLDATSLQDFIRYLIDAKPESLVLFTAHNVERGDNIRWDNLTAVVTAKRGLLLTVEPLGHQAVSDWFHRALGRWPTATELDALVGQTGGRPYDLGQAFNAIRNGGMLIDSDYSRFYLNKRREITGEARTIAELLAIMPYDATVGKDALAAAAAKLGVSHVGPPLDTLDKHRLLKSTASGLALTHALAQDTWRAGLSEPRAAELVSGWLEAFNQNKSYLLTGPDAAAIIPIIATPLVRTLSAVEVAQIGNELLKAGQVDVGLEFVDSGWKYKLGGEEGGDDVDQQALIAAKTRLELGRYSQVDEPLAVAEQSTNAVTRVEALLLRMKLALRRNTYSLLWALAEQLERVADDKEYYAEGQATLNVAYRDLLDYDGIRGTTDKLIQLRESLVARTQMAIDRSIARGLAKLGDLDTALTTAVRAVEAASEIGTARDLGNAYLARGEVRRYRREFEAALADYRLAEELGRGMGNRDSQLWSLLGFAAAQIESGSPEGARMPLDQVTAMLAEPGYEHPIESAHLQLLRVMAGGYAGEVTPVMEAYESLGIYWPRAILEGQGSGLGTREPTPL